MASAGTVDAHIKVSFQGRKGVSSGDVSHRRDIVMVAGASGGSIAMRYSCFASGARHVH
jgi:hypothetical protein